MLLCCSVAIMHAKTHIDHEYMSWANEVKKYTTEPNFSHMPNNILESYRFVWEEGWGNGYTQFIRISKIQRKDSLSYVVDSADIGYYSKKRIHASITKNEWEELRNTINNMLSYHLASRDKRRVFDAGLLLLEVYNNGKKFYIWRYNIHTKKDSDALRVFYRVFSEIKTFNTKSIVKNKQVYDLQKELDEKKRIEEEGRKKQYEEEAKKQKAIYESELLWKSATTGVVGGIGYFKNVNANIKNKQGQTPLMMAVKNGYTDVVRALGEAIVNVKETDNDGKTAFEHIKVPTTKEEQIYTKRMYGALRVLEVEQLIRGYAKMVSYQYENDRDFLNILIRGETCYRFKFPKNTQCKEMPKPKKISHKIFKYIKTKDDDMFDSLLKEVDLNITNRHDYSLLWAGIHYQNLYVVDKVLKKGIDINQLDNNKLHKPISWAIIHNDAGLLQVLLDNGVDVNSQGKFGDPILFNALYKCKSFKTISMLLEHGANPYLKDKRGNTVFEKEPVFCKDKSNIEKMKKLLHSKDGEGLKSQSVELNAKAKRVYLQEEEARRKKKFDTYLSTLSDINMMNAEGFTPLAKAVATKDYYAMTKLIEKGADINILDGKYGVWTPFNYTIAMNDVKALKIFLDHGADVNFYNKGKSTVLNDAIRMCNVSIVKLLLDNGANPRIKDGYGGTVVNSLKKCDEKVKREVTKLVNDTMKKSTNNTLQTVEKIEFKTAIEKRKNKDKIDKIKAYVESKKNTNTPIFETIKYKKNIDFDKYLKTLDNVDLKDKQGNTLLYMAVEKRNYYAMKKLLAHGANMYYINDYRTYSPFSYAVGLSDTRAVKLFIDSGVNANHQYKKSLTALSLAVKQCNIDIIKLLLDSGADVALEDKRGDNAIKSLGNCNKKDNKTIKDLIEKKES